MRYKSNLEEMKNERGDERGGRKTNATEDLQDTPERMSKICDIQNSHRWNNQKKKKIKVNVLLIFRRKHTS